MKKLQIIVNGKEYIVDVQVLEDDENLGGVTYATAKPSTPTVAATTTRTSTQSRPAVSLAPAVELEAPINGTIVEILAKPGDKVCLGQALIGLEAMKMKTSINAPADAVVKTVDTAIGDTVEVGQVLMTFE